MRRLYSDLHLCPNIRDFEQTTNMIRKAAKLGYHLIAITLPPNAGEKESRQMKDTCDEAGMDAATRVDLRPNAPNELVRDLRRLRRKFEIVCVMCESKNVSRQAARDRRVDLLNFPSVDFRRRFFDLAEAELASNSLASLEIDMGPLITSETPTRVRLLTSLRREASIADGFNVPIVVSSGAQNERLIRRPMEIAITTSLFGLKKHLALDTVSKNPSTIVKRNREKLSATFVAPGIRVLRRGKNC
jgi:RNase P/RNase MRP subunit p30